MIISKGEKIGSHDIRKTQNAIEIKNWNWYVSSRELKIYGGNDDLQKGPKM